MKRINFFCLLSCILLLGLVGCTADRQDEPGALSDGSIALEVRLAGNAQTRASSIGVPTNPGDAGVDVVYIQAYDVDGNPALEEIVKLQLVNGAATTTLNLPSTGSYSIAFWAQNSHCTVYDLTNFPSVTAKYPAGQLNNDSTLTAFYATVGSVQPVLVNQMTVTLQRAVAQVNVGMNYQGYLAMNANKKPNLSEVVFTGLPTTFDVLKGTTVSPANADTTITFAFDDAIITRNDGLNSSPLTVKTDSATTYYAWVSMSYVLAPSTVLALPSAQFYFENAAQAGSTPVYTQQFQVRNIPITQNYRTNVIAALASDVTFVIQTDYAMAGDQENIISLDGTQFSSLQPDADGIIDFGDNDVVIDLAGSSAAAPMYLNEYKQQTAVKLQCRNLLIENGTITSGMLWLCNTGEASLYNLTFTGSAGSVTSQRVVIGDAAATSATQFATKITLYGLDFTNMDVCNNAVYIDGGLVTLNGDTPAPSNGTQLVTVGNCKFANTGGDAIRIIGLASDAQINMTGCSFDLPYQIQTVSFLDSRKGYPGNAINVSNSNGSTDIQINSSNSTFEYVPVTVNGTTYSAFGTSNQVWEAGLVGVGPYTNLMDNETTTWSMATWAFKFLNIGYGTATSSTLIDALNPGVQNSLIGFLKGTSTSLYPTSAQINNVVVSTDFSAYPSGYFTTK